MHRAETRRRRSLSRAPGSETAEMLANHPPDDRPRAGGSGITLGRPNAENEITRRAGLRSWPGSTAQNATRTRRVITPVVNRWAFESCHSHYSADDSSHLNILDFVTQLQSARVVPHLHRVIFSFYFFFHRDSSVQFSVRLFPPKIFARPHLSCQLNINKLR